MAFFETFSHDEPTVPKFFIKENSDKMAVCWKDEAGATHIVLWGIKPEFTREKMTKLIAMLEETDEEIES